tara:strand:- start:211 stop:1101 length:891 start_codon:yes stop_codon:yes gene_type:complete
MNIKQYLLIASVGFLLFSCGEEVKKSEINIDNPQEPTIDIVEKSVKIQKIFFNIPSPIETSQILQEAGATYEFSLPSNPSAVDDYQSIEEQALNMGVYGADLNYATVFDKTTEIMLYLQCARTLGNELGIKQVFDEETIDRIEWNLEIKDSMQIIITEIFWEMNSYLEEEGRLGISALIIAGGWLEGLHLSTQLARIAPENEILKLRIAEQKYSLTNLIGLLNSYDSNHISEDILEDLQELDAIFSKITAVKTAGENQKDKNGVTIIGGSIKLAMDDVILEEITAKILEIRTEIIN